MARQRRLPRAQDRPFSQWYDSLKGRLSDTTITTYGTDAARFLCWLGDRELASVDSALAAKFLDTLTPAGRSRMLSALSDFFAFARENRLIAVDPLRTLKYKRKSNSDERQLSFLDLLMAEGIAAPVARRLIWADFIAPLVDEKEAQLRVGRRTVVIDLPAWKRLERHFRTLTVSNELTELLKRHIA